MAKIKITKSAVDATQSHAKLVELRDTMVAGGHPGGDEAHAHQGPTLKELCIKFKPGKTPRSRLGRGHLAVHFTGQSLSATSRRDPVKVRLVYLKQAGARSTITHLRYIEREGADREQDTGQA